MTILSKMDPPITEIARTGNVARLLRQEPKATSIECCLEGRRAAETVLGQVTRARRGTPAIVLVDDSGFSEYHPLMTQGALECLQVGEGPSVIARGLKWARPSAGGPERRDRDAK